MSLTFQGFTSLKLCFNVSQEKIFLPRLLGKQTEELPEGEVTFTYNIKSSKFEHPGHIYQPLFCFT